ncbi:hypothetical protein [uncultured Nostoc sp.]
MIYRVSRVRCGDVGGFDWQLRCLTNGGLATSLVCRDRLPSGYIIA